MAMILRPYRSASFPQRGPTNEVIKGLIPRMRPDQTATAALDSTPSCAT